MAAFKLALQIDQGATFEKGVTWKTGKPPSPVDLTGCSALMQVRETLLSKTVLLELSTEAGGGIVLGGELGTVALRIEADVTAAFIWRSAVYDLEIVFADGTTKRRLLSGAVTVSPEVTR